MTPTRLFSEFDLGSVIENQKAKVREMATQVGSEKLLVEDIDSLAEEVAEKIRIDFIVLNSDAITVEQKETQVDVSRDPMRHISDRSRPFYIDGISVSYFLPFTGDAQLLKCRPNTYTTVLPYARIGKNELVFEFSVTDGNILPTKQWFEKELGTVKQYVGWIENQVKEYNESLTALIRPHLEKRLQQLETSKAQIGNLGFAVRPKESLTETEAIVYEALTKKVGRAVPKSSGSKVTKSLPEKQYDVALSFAGENRKYVDQVANYLRDAKVNVFYDEFEKVNLWGKNLVDHLGKVYSQQSRFIVMFISEHYSLKSWPNHERKSAQDRATKMQEDCILPVRFDGSEIPGMPSSVGFVDANEVTPQNLADLIVEKINQS